mgnify:CR=1 FL=1
MTLDQVHYVLFGEDLLRSGVKPYVDYFYHLGEMEQTVNFFATNQDVEAFMQADGGRLVNRLIGGLQVHPSVFDVEMWEFSPKIHTSLASAFLSMMMIENGKLYANGIYLLKEDKLGMKLPMDDAFMLKLINKKRSDELTFVFPGEEIAFQVHRYGWKLRVKPQSADVYVHAAGWVIGGRNKGNRTVLSGQDQLIARKIEDNLERILRKAHAQGIDYLGIGEKFRQKKLGHLRLAVPLGKDRRRRSRRYCRAVRKRRRVRPEPPNALFHGLTGMFRSHGLRFRPMNGSERMFRRRIDHIEL